MKCPCNSGLVFTDCCEPILSGKAKAKTCEQLMRSRYSAFVEQAGEHLFNTYHPDFRGETTQAELAESGAQTNWKSLDIVSSQGAEGDLKGTVEFRAWFIAEGQLQVHHEKSNFVRLNGDWVYTDGIFNPDGNSARIGRNDPCPCGSGKKFKKCCG